MLNKFFTRRPQKGKPLALRGMADGLAGMDNAWATMTGEGCYISWSNGTPTIVIESAADSGGWELGGDYLTCYGESIGAHSGVGAATSVIDLINRDLEGGVWSVTDTTAGGFDAGALKVDGGAYVAKGLYGTGVYGTAITTIPAARFLTEVIPDSVWLYDVTIGNFSEALHATDSSGDYVAKLISTATGDEFAAYFTDGSGSVRICGLSDDTVEVVGSVDTTVSYKVADTKVVGARGLTVDDPTGGATIDAEARSAIDAIIDRLQSHGLIS